MKEFTLEMYRRFYSIIMRKNYVKILLFLSEYRTIKEIAEYLGLKHNKLYATLKLLNIAKVVQIKKIYLHKGHAPSLKYRAIYFLYPENKYGLGQLTAAEKGITTIKEAQALGYSRQYAYKMIKPLPIVRYERNPASITKGHIKSEIKNYKAELYGNVTNQGVITAELVISEATKESLRELLKINNVKIIGNEYNIKITLDNDFKEIEWKEEENINSFSLLKKCLMENGK